jgi:hypothetical protein
METYDNLSGSMGRTPASDQLRSTATSQEAILEAINKFKETSNEYSATNAEVITNKAIDDRYLTPIESVNFYRPDNEYRSPE